MTVKIEVKGPIISSDEAWIYEWFEMDATSPGRIAKELTNANGEDIIVSINSPGGYVHEGSEIYTALKNYPGQVEVQIVGLAASAASVIAMAGDKVRISPTAQIMIHNASMWNGGDHRDMSKAAEMLKTTDRAIVNAYVIKSGKSEEELLNMMAEETWMGPQQALENNFVDEIMFMDNPVKMTAPTATAAMLPQKVIDGFRNGTFNKGKTDGITKEDLNAALSGLKNEILNDLQNNIEEQPKEPNPKPVKNSGIKGLLLKL
ncbi:Clp protease ClpP [Bacillus paranthracis]|uniref:head maturation protease, ClpP-related n=1 Tax=Bacillus cereus group TaxID=86661 RepID=UPI0005009BDE|nr:MULTISPECIES: head maturation protease, ClpP-related [Bacillus cereus group]KFL84490.1 clp protease family protein [Bacillus cereus]MRA60580.1 Clp protease ClpP [Bacillus thuringiensis]OUB99727.1 peptidase [Bacillus thuringiensis serovar canadensis]CKE77075.1 scaffolding protein [Streptococcus pneumoniae]MBE5110864.1 Clp protease ClpP [Bacillus paranthracis]